MKLGELHEFALTLDKVGVDADLAEGVTHLKSNKLAKATYAALKTASQKFALFADLGTITVPNDYVHSNQLDLFAKQNRDKFCGYNDAITDANFPNPSRILKPGDKLRVRAFKQVVSGTTTSEERMAFLATRKAIYVGAQGVSLVWEQKRDQLPKDYWYASLDEKDRLWKDADGDHRVPGVDAHSGGAFHWEDTSDDHWVPGVDAHSGGAFHFILGSFEVVWFGDYALLCFCNK